MEQIDRILSSAVEVAEEILDLVACNCREGICDGTCTHSKAEYLIMSILEWYRDTQRVFFKEVDLIASGYEWTCPGCDTLNSEIEATSEEYCDECGLLIITGEVHHAYE